MVLAALLAGAPPASDDAAAQLRPRVELAPYAGGFFAGDLERQELRDAPILGARLGVRLPLGPTVEAQLGWSPLESRRVGAEERAFDVTALLLEAGLLYALPLPGPVDPFLGLAAGQVRFDPDLAVEGQELDDETSWVASAGAGVRVSLGSWGLRADLRDHLILDALEDTSNALGGDGGETLNALEASVGVSFLF